MRHEVRGTRVDQGAGFLVRHTIWTDAKLSRQFNHRVVKAQWSDGHGQWALTLKPTHGGDEVNDTVDLVVSATGFLNHWEFPHIEGLENFKGTLFVSPAVSFSQVPKSDHSPVYIQLPGRWSHRMKHGGSTQWLL